VDSPSILTLQVLQFKQLTLSNEHQWSPVRWKFYCASTLYSPGRKPSTWSSGKIFLEMWICITRTCPGHGKHFALITAHVVTIGMNRFQRDQKKILYRYIVGGLVFVSFDSGPLLSFEIFQQQSSMRVQELVSTDTETKASWTSGIPFTKHVAIEFHRLILVSNFETEKNTDFFRVLAPYCYLKGWTRTLPRPAF
jgi:hypothetical protein